MNCIETERLQLRQWKENDFSAFAAYYADENNAKYVGGQKNSDEAWRHMALQIGHWQLKRSWAQNTKTQSIYWNMDLIVCIATFDISSKP